MAPFCSSLSFIFAFDWVLFYLKIQNERKDGEVLLSDLPRYTVSLLPVPQGHHFSCVLPR